MAASTNRTYDWTTAAGSLVVVLLPATSDIYAKHSGWQHQEERQILAITIL